MEWSFVNVRGNLITKQARRVGQASTSEGDSEGVLVLFQRSVQAMSHRSSRPARRNDGNREKGVFSASSKAWHRVAIITKKKNGKRMNAKKKGK